MTRAYGASILALAYLRYHISSAEQQLMLQSACMVSTSLLRAEAPHSKSKRRGGRLPDTQEPLSHSLLNIRQAGSRCCFERISHKERSNHRAANARDHHTAPRTPSLQRLKRRFARRASGNPRRAGTKTCCTTELRRTSLCDVPGEKRYMQREYTTKSVSSISQVAKTNGHCRDRIERTSKRHLKRSSRDLHSIEKMSKRLGASGRLPSTSACPLCP